MTAFRGTFRQSFAMRLRDQDVDVDAELTFAPDGSMARVTVGLTDRSGRVLPWTLTREELAEVCRVAGRTARINGTPGGIV